MKRKGFTLIELLAVIVVLAIIAVIAIPIVMNVIKSAKKGAFETTLSNVKEATEYYSSRIELTESLDECRYFSFEKDVQIETTIDGKLYVPIKELDLKGGIPTKGEVEVCPENIFISVSDDNYSGVIDGETTIVAEGKDVSKGDKVPATIRRISTETTATTIRVTVDAYPGKYGKIEKYEYSLNDKKHYVESNETYVFENLDFDTEYTIYVRVTTTAGVITEGNINVKTDYALLSVTANGYSGTYDGKAHGITVSSSGATIQYGEKEGTYNLTESPTYTDVGTYTVYYQVTRKGYKPTTGKRTVIITKANGSISLSNTSGSYTYPTAGSFTVTKNTSGGALSCSSSNTSVATCKVSGTTITVTPGTTAGNATLTITSAGTDNYNEASTTYTATTASGILSVTASGYTGIYDGYAHGITVSSNGATIKYGEKKGTYNLTESPTYTDAGSYTIYYQVTRPGYKTVTGSKTVTITKADGTVTLPSSNGTVTYPTARTFTVTGNTSGGVLGCTTSNSAVATCTVSGNIVTVTPGTTAGQAIITVTSATTMNYNEASATYTVTTASGILSVTASDRTVTYNGSAQTLSISCDGATIKYGTTAGTYNLTTIPTYTDAGTYTIYYQVSKPGYKTVTGSKTLTINKANGDVNLSANSGTITYPTPTMVTVTKNISGGTLSCSSSNTSVATCSLTDTGSSTRLDIFPLNNPGTATITVTSTATKNYKAASASYTVTTVGALSVTANGYSGTYDGSAHGISVTSSGATIKYSKDGITYSSNPITYTDVGTYTVYYQVSRTGYKTVTGSKTVTISKATGTLSLSASQLSIVGGNSSSFRASHYKGTLSCSSGNISIVGCSVSSDGTIKVSTAPASSSHVTITVKSAATKNYTEASKEVHVYTTGPIASNTVNGVTTNYTSLSDAFGASTTGTTTLLTSTSVNLTVSATTNKTLNLNGNTLTGNISNTGTLTINGSGTITNSSSAISNGGAMTINNVALKTTSSAVAVSTSGKMSLKKCSFSTNGPYYISNTGSNFVELHDISDEYGLYGDNTSSNYLMKYSGKFMRVDYLGSGHYQLALKGATATHVRVAGYGSNGPIGASGDEALTSGSSSQKTYGYGLNIATMSNYSSYKSITITFTNKYYVCGTTKSDNVGSMTYVIN